MRPVRALSSIGIWLIVLSGCSSEEQPRATQSDEAQSRDVGGLVAGLSEPVPPRPSPTESAPAEAHLPPRRRITMDDGIGLDMIPPSAFMAVFIRPREIVESPALADTFQGDFLRDFVRQRVVDPHEVERYLWLFWDSGAAPDLPPAQCIVNRFIEGYDAWRLLDVYWGSAMRATGKGAQERTWEGVTYYKPPVSGNFSAYLPDERTLLLTAEAHLQHLLTTAGEPGPLANKARQLDLGQHAVIVLVLESFEKQAQRLLGSMANALPQRLRGITVLADGVKTASLSIDLENDVTASLALEAKEPGATPTLAATARIWLATAKSVLPPGRQPTPAFAQQAQSPTSILFSSLLQTAEVVEESDQVFVRFHRPEGFEVLVARAAQTMIPRKDLKANWVERALRLRDVARAMLRYNDLHGHFPVWASRSPDGTPLLSWRVHLLPFLGEESLHEQFHLDEPWDSEHNVSLVERMPAVYRSHDELRAGMTSFMIFVGEEAPFGDEQGIRMIDVWDGPSNTIMVVEAGADKAVPWTKPEDLPFDPKNPVSALGQSDLARFSAAYFDGSVHGVTREIKPKILRRLISHHDSMETPADSFTAPMIDFDEPSEE